MVSQVNCRMNRIAAYLLAIMKSTNNANAYKVNLIHLKILIISVIYISKTKQYVYILILHYYIKKTIISKNTYIYILSQKISYYIK